MDEHTLRVLEFFKVREALSEHASSGPGREGALALVPVSDAKAVERSLKETRELKSLLETGGGFPIAGLRDIAGSLKKAVVEGASLRPEELLHVQSVARTSRLIKSSLGKGKDHAPLLNSRAQALGVFEALEADILRAVGEDGEVLDSASFELRRIRRSLTLVRSRINKELEEIVQSPAYAKAVQEPVITMRGDRYVLPLKPNFRMYLQGIVHDHSSSGSTVFVEPEKTVDLNNKLTQLRLDERREVERVLMMLTSRVRESGDELSGSFSALVALDVIYAKAQYALTLGAQMPAVAPGGWVELRQARHPILVRTKGADAVPIDVNLGRDFSCLVITGPNTGGKTVVLKTVGLLCLMAQAGMLIPAAPDSAVPVFENVFSDIGDEQSVEQNLSTFSSHVSQIVRIMKGAGRDSLVLLDELGAGTDPAEGSALGVAIVSELHRRGAKVIVTTHHGALKVFAANTQGVMNASVEFDAETLMPTYRLLIGRPGRSNALVVAERLGMPKGIIEAAARTRGEGEVALDSLIEKLEKEAQAAREEREKAARETMLAREEKARLQEIVKRAEEERKEAVRKAREKASGVLSSLRFKLRELEDMGRRQAMPERAEVKKAAQEVQALEASLAHEEAAPAPVKALEIEAISVGDSVKVYKYRKTGKVLSIKRDKKQVVVQLDTMKVTLGVDELELAGKVKPAAAKSVAYTLTRDEEEDGGGGIEINIIGQRVEEASEKLEKFLDQCMLAGLGQARIIHGRGTGALRKMAAEKLKGHPGVESWRFEAFEQGGDAVTVAVFRK